MKIDILSHNTIIVKFTIFKPTLKSDGKKAIKLRIYNFPYCKTNIKIKYPDLLDILKPYGFDEKYISFDGIQSDDYVYVMVGNITTKDHFLYITEHIKSLYTEKCNISISYGLYNNDLYYRENYDFLPSQYVDKIVLHNLKGYSRYKFIQSNDDSSDELFFNKKYKLEEKVKSIAYVTPKTTYTLMFKRYKGNEIIQNFQSKPEFKRILRYLKLNELKFK